MTFLKKLAQIILQATEIATGFAPLFTKVVPQSAGVIATVQSDLALVGQEIVSVEAFGQALSLPGAQKLQAAVGPVSQIILQSALVSGKKIANQALFAQGAQKVADGVADILNSIDQNEASAVKPQDVK